MPNAKSYPEWIYQSMEVLSGLKEKRNFSTRGGWKSVIEKIKEIFEEISTQELRLEIIGDQH